MMMDYLQTNHPLGVDVAGRRGFRGVLSGILIFLPSIVGLGAETVVPLVTPAITPVQESPAKGKEPGPVLGFTPLAEDVPVALPVGEGAFGILPGDPNTELFIFDGDVEPLIAINPLMVDLNPSENIPVEIKDPAEDPLSGDLAATNDLASLPWPPAGGAFGSGRLFSGFSDPRGIASVGGGLLNTLRQGFSLSAALTGTYDTNPSQGYSTAANSGQGDFFTTLDGTATYRSIASTWTYAVIYAGSYNQYLNQTELSGYNQNAEASLNYESDPLTAGVTFGISSGSGANRNYGSVVNEITYNCGIDARYRISRKTALTADVSQSITTSSGGTSTGSFELGASALWSYSSLIEFGPGIRYTLRTGDLQQDRTTIGPSLAVNYQLAQKVQLSSMIGMDFVSYEKTGSTDPTLFTSIDLNYRPSSLWWMSLSLLRDAEASYSTVAEFEETTALRIGYNRNIRRALWTVGVGWENRTSDNPNPLAPIRPDRNFLTLDTGLSMPIFDNTTQAHVFIRYSDQSTGGADSWDSLQVGFGLNRQF